MSHQCFPAIRTTTRRRLFSSVYNSINSILASVNDRRSCRASVSDREWPSSPFKNASRGYRIIKSHIIDSVGRHVITLIAIRSAYHRRLANRACRAKTTLVGLVNTRSRTHVLYPERSMNSFIIYMCSSSHFLFCLRIAFTKKVAFHAIIFGATKKSADDTLTRGIMTGDPEDLNLQHCLKFDSFNKSFHRDTSESLCTQGLIAIIWNCESLSNKHECADSLSKKFLMLVLCIFYLLQCP